MYGTPQFGRARGGTYLTGAALSRSRRKRLQRFSGLGSLTPDQAVETIFPSAKVSNKAGETAAVRSLMVRAVQAGQMVNASGQPAYIPGTADCSASGVSVGQVTLTTIASVATKIAPMTGPAAPFVAIGAGIVGLFGALRAHHAAAVKKEQSTLCAAVPAANNYLTLIDQAVQSGQSSPTDGINALSSLLSDFKSQVNAIIKGNSPVDGSCNAACVMYSQLAAICAYRASVYQDLAAQQAANPVGTALAPITNLLSPIESAVASAGLPSWLLPAAGFFLLWEFL